LVHVLCEQMEEIWPCLDAAKVAADVAVFAADRPAAAPE
jgi:hypothetical protein